MDRDDFLVLGLLVVLVVMGFIVGQSVPSTSTRKEIVNQLCQKKVYDFCEVAGYKMKGTN